MTHQASDKLVNEYESLDIGGLLLYHVSVGLPEPPRVDANYRCSALWRGYIATFRINPAGTFELLQFEIPHFEGKPTIQELKSGLYWGDFEITLRPFFTGPKTVIPFKSGVIVSDQQQWAIEKREICGWNIERSTPNGYMVETQAGKGFIPTTLVPDDLSSLLENGYQGTADCLIQNFDSERECFILELTKLNHS